MKLSLKYDHAHVDLETRPDLIAKLRADLQNCLERFPKAAEGVIYLDGFEYFFTYETDERDQIIEVILQPRELAESVLNEHGLSTYEPWAPYKRAKQ